MNFKYVGSLEALVHSRNYYNKGLKRLYVKVCALSLASIFQIRPL